MGNSIQFNTAQNVNIELEVATIGQRISGYLLDSLIIIAYVFFLFYVLSNGFSFDDSIGRGIGFMIIPLLLPIMFYSLLFEIFFNGQSPGKQIVGTRVVNLSGEKVTVGQYLIRWLFRMVDFQIFGPLVAVLAVALGKNGQRVGDMVAGTSVIDTKTKRLARIDQFHDIEPDYLPKYQVAKQLNDQEIRLIKEVIANRSENRFSIVTTMADKVQETLLITKEESSEDFLKKIIKDHQYYKTIYLESPDKKDFV